MIEINDIATPEWLNQSLKEAGFLNDGQVKKVIPHPQKLTFFSAPKVASLEIQYSDDCISPPPNLLLKIANGVKECIFFSEISPIMENSEIIKCYYAKHSSENEQSYFLLEDVTSTHFQTDWPIPPQIHQCFNAIDCVAKIHSFWWDHPRLKKDLLEKCNQGNHWSGRINLAVSNLSAFFDFIGDRLSQERKQIYERVLSSSDQTWRPRQAENGQTLLHGDAHFWNFLYPLENGMDKIRIIDWNSWDIGRATDDLAYMIGLHWYPDHRKVYEINLLKNYHTRLQESNIHYQWDELWQDYRKSTIMNLFIPVWQWHRGINAAVWWSHLERGFSAYHDLDCAAVLGK